MTPDIQQWIARITDQVPMLNEVGGAAELDSAYRRSEQEQDWAFPSPSAYVLLLRDIPITQTATTVCTIQQMRTTLGVLIAINSTKVYAQREPAGHEAMIEIQPVRDQVMTALLGWAPDPNTTPALAAGGEVRNFSNGLLFWLERFEFIYQLRATR